MQLAFAKPSSTAAAQRPRRLSRKPLSINVPVYSCKAFSRCTSTDTSSSNSKQAKKSREQQRKMSDWISGVRNDMQWSPELQDVRTTMNRFGAPSPKCHAAMQSPIASTSQVKVEDTYLPQDEDQAWQFPDPETSQPEAHEELPEDVELPSDPSVPESIPDPSINELPDVHHSLSPSSSSSISLDQYMAQQSSSPSESYEQLEQLEMSPEELAKQEAEVQTYEDLDTAYTEAPIRFVPPKITSPSPTSDPQDPVLPRPHYQPKPIYLESLYDLRLRATSQTGKQAPWLVSRREADLAREASHPLTIAQSNSLLAYSTRQLSLIEMERKTVQEKAEKRLKAKAPKPGDRHVLFDMVARWEDEAGQKVWKTRLGRSRGQEIEGAKVLVCEMQDKQEHDLRSGSRIMIRQFPAPEMKKAESGEPAELVPHVLAELLRVEADRLFLLVPKEDIPIMIWDRVRLDYAWDERIFRLMTTAQARLNLDLEAQEEHQAFIDNKANFVTQTWHTSLILEGTHLRDIIVPPSAPDIRVKQSPPSDLLTSDARLNSWVQRHLRQPFIPMDGDPTSDLNSTQIQAIAMALNERFSLIQGPPGTGKSATITNLLTLLKVDFQIPTPVLVCAPTHAAVDHLTRNMALKRLKPLRIGREEQVHPDNVRWTMPMWQKRSPQYGLLLFAQNREVIAKAKLDAVERNDEEAIAALGIRAEDQDVKKLDEAHEKAKRAVWNIHNRVTQWVFSQADVVLSTAMGASGYATKCVDFPIVLLDEAAQCNEATSLIPLMKGCRHAVLIGDHKQLPGICESQEAAAAGFSVSLFERLIHAGHVPSVMLGTQYRMAPDIAEFSSKEFYHGKLQNGLNTAHRTTQVKLEYLDSGQKVLFLDHEGRETRGAKSSFNREEAMIVVELVRELFQRNPGMTSRDIGIISPYIAQTKLLKSMLCQEFGWTAESQDAVEVRTVDGFQGREKDVIIFSAVRSNAARRIGFLAEARRLNVALTRSKMATIVVGSESTLGQARSEDSDIPHSGVWERYVKWAKDRGFVKRWLPRSA